MLTVESAELKEVKILRWEEKRDNRGLKIFTYSKRELEKIGIVFNYVEEAVYQIEKKNTLYGIHYQNNPKPHAKLVICTKGKGLDYIVDLRRSSPTYKKWIMIPLDSREKKQIYVPKGFGHAFLSTQDDTHIVFRIDEYFDPEFSRSISYKDKDLGIEFNTADPILSQQDVEAPTLKDSDCNL